MCQFVAQRGTVATLVDVLDKHSGNQRIVRNAANALDHLGKLFRNALLCTAVCFVYPRLFRSGKNKVANLRQFWENQRNAGQTDLKQLARIFKVCVEQHMNDSDTVVALVKAFAQFPREGEGLLLKVLCCKIILHNHIKRSTAFAQEAGVFDMIQEAVAIYPDDGDLELACAELVQNCAPEDMVQAYMQQIVNADAAGDTKSLDDAMENLNVLLLAPLPNPDVALANEEQVWEVLSRRLASGLFLLFYL